MSAWGAEGVTRRNGRWRICKCRVLHSSTAARQLEKMPVRRKAARQPNTNKNRSKGEVKCKGNRRDGQGRKLAESVTAASAMLAPHLMQTTLQPRVLEVQKKTF